jgi:hypothetical protein
MFRPRLVLAAVLSSVLSLGCSFQAKEGVGTNGTGSNPFIPDAGALPDRNYTSADLSALVGDACPSNSFVANNLPPDLLIVLDRSGSMNEDSTGTTCMGGCGATSKWSQMTAAINQVVANTETKVRWGLKFFASSGGGGSCMVNATAEVPVGPMNAAAIAAAITATTPGSSTPTRAAETQAAAYLAAVTDPNPKYILLATDGLPNCMTGGGANATDEVAAIAAVSTVAAMGIPTFVIGVATSGSTADGTLNMMAMNGGHPRAATPLYYPVATSMDLQLALADIQGMVALPCQFQLPGVPSNLGAVSVTVGGQVVQASDWMYGPGNRSIVFPDAGALCMSLKSGAVKDVKINLPCGDVIIP